MRIVVIVQARTGSSRLPGKVLRRVGRQTILTHVLARAKRIPGAHEVVVATTTDPLDDAIVNLARGAGIRWVRGPEEDVLGRFVMAADALRADTVVRLTSDCPLLDPAVAGRVLRTFLRAVAAPTPACWYVSNVHPPSWYDGCDVEVFSRAALQEADQCATSTEREHVTTRIWRRANERINVALEGEDHSRLKLSVDTAEDLDRVRRTYAALHDKEAFGWQDVVAAHRVAFPTALERRAVQIFGRRDVAADRREAYLAGASATAGLAVNPHSTGDEVGRRRRDAWLLGFEDGPWAGA